MGNEPAMEEAQPVNGDPPSYTETANEAPPPSYDSIFGELREARRQTDGHPQFLQRVFSILCASGVSITIVILLFILVSLYSLVFLRVVIWFTLKGGGPAQKFFRAYF